MSKFSSTLGRICVSLIFILSGCTKIHNHLQTGGVLDTHILTKMDEFVLNVDSLTTLYGNYKIPIQSIQNYYPILLIVAGALEVFGGLLFIFNIHLGGYILLMLLIPFSIIVHNFWAVDDSQQLSESIHFFKNMAIFGGIYAYLHAGTTKYPSKNKKNN